ncbi:hypothetical protein HS088_TW02G00303 [Tripterygium wilfordii]|uniref:Uncharacterized protein n=1 Tax=Tripterygium wilfordii TaxID=458696 RepID=A0A7J7DY27_TRIWF|nr:uncharacterized protein LOC120006557 [Tripterygium wilfordii]XP_038712558.1 uncharacterized protein LOC120006557 [Tripterygium wilfordii]KAF5751290.1 hypothetical protein HS088_TW02G00303 [Tripterygium wilfordii]
MNLSEKDDTTDSESEIEMEISGLLDSDNEDAELDIQGEDEQGSVIKLGKRKREAIYQLMDYGLSKTLSGGGFRRKKTRDKLCNILRKLVGQHDWKTASQVVMVLLKRTFTCRDKSHSTRLIFSVLLELIKQVDSGYLRNPYKMQKIYAMWLRRVQSKEDKVSILVECTLHFLTQRKPEEALNLASSLMQQDDLPSLPISNMIIGMIFYIKSFSSVAKDMQYAFSDSWYSPKEPNTLGSKFNDQVGNSAASNAEGWHLWLLPCKSLLSTDEGIKYDLDYKRAVEYLRLALDSSHPMLPALAPLIQLLLFGRKFDEAFDTVNKFCENSHTPLPFRLKASLLEHFCGDDYAMLSACYEDILKRDPTCSYSLERLVSMHNNGDYAVESLFDMIVLHLDGTFAQHKTWKEFADCFLKLYKIEKDGNVLYSICKDSIKTWKLRRRWWSRRHFSPDILASEIAGGDFPLLTYKAACAYHLYGMEFGYVSKACACLEKEQINSDLFAYLKNSTSIPSYFM